MEADRFALGLRYDAALTLTQLVPKNDEGKPVVNDKVYLDRLFISYIDSGDMNIVSRNKRTDAEVSRRVRSDFGTVIGLIPWGTALDLTRVYTETGRRQLYTRGRTEDIEIEFHSDSHLGSRLAAVSQAGTLIPQ